MTKRSALIKKLDKIFSNKVRERDLWNCQFCGKHFTPPTDVLQSSHYFSRRFLGTRWNLDNLDSLCLTCHGKAENDKRGFYEQFMKDKLGEEGLERLRMKAYAITKISTVDLERLFKSYV